jgi:two-component system osmolarity sensor histidine kinase EnvZ
VGFSIERDRLLAARRLARPPLAGSTPRVWLGIAAAGHAVGLGGGRAADQPAADQLSFAASRIREGEYDSRLDENTLTSEIREVNMGFNRMARELAKVEEDRAVMLAGISHDLRTPLARLRLEAEMSVRTRGAQRNMASRHRPARRHHRQVHGLRAPGRDPARPVPLAELIEQGGGDVPRPEQIRITLRVAAT